MQLQITVSNLTKPGPNQTKGLFSLSAQDLPPIFYRRPRYDPQTDFKVTHNGPKFKRVTYSLIAIPWFVGFFLISTLMRFSIYIYFFNFTSTKSNLVVYLAKSYIPGNLQKLGYLKRWSEGLSKKGLTRRLITHHLFDKAAVYYSCSIAPHVRDKKNIIPTYFFRMLFLITAIVYFVVSMVIMNLLMYIDVVSHRIVFIIVSKNYIQIKTSLERKCD